MFKLFKAKQFAMWTKPHTTKSGSMNNGDTSQYVVTMGCILGIGYIYARSIVIR